MRNYENKIAKIWNNSGNHYVFNFNGFSTWNLFIFFCPKLYQFQWN